MKKTDWPATALVFVLGVGPAWGESSDARRDLQAAVREFQETLQVMVSAGRSSGVGEMRETGMLLNEIDRDLEGLADPHGIQKSIRGISEKLMILNSGSRVIEDEDARRIAGGLGKMSGRLRELVPRKDMERFAALSSEGRNKGNLGAIRSAMSIYYGDMEGRYPDDPSELTAGGKYLREIPLLRLEHHRSTREFRILGTAGGGRDIQRLAGDSGKWLYVGDPGSPNFGSVFIDCTHKDSKGVEWYKY